MKNNFAEKLGLEFTDVFELHRGTESTKKLCFVEAVEKLSAAERTHVIDGVTKALRNKGLIRGWRNELLPVVTHYSSDPAFLIERAAAPYFGIKGYGVHVNGYVRDASSSTPTGLWVATRSKSKSTWPGMLDHIVAGAQPHGISPSDNVIKECGEEANISVTMAKAARPVGAISYRGSDEQGLLKRDTLFCYDLELPVDFKPRPVDGEVESFELQTLDWVVKKVSSGGSTGYKPNCNIVIIDFLIRHGIIPSDAPHYLELVGMLRTGECS